MASDPGVVTSLFGEGLHFASVVVLGIISYFFKRGLDNLAKLETQVADLKTKVAILLDRDRQRRISDYEEEAQG